MKILIIYDSFFGNTQDIAKAIAGALQSGHEVELHRVGDVRPRQISKVDVLIVGSPTRGFKATAAIIKYISSLPAKHLKGKRVAAFDTRISIEEVNSRFLSPLIRIFGYAAKPIADKLHKKGGELIAPPEGFIVLDSEGPLKEGERERAARWAEHIIGSIS
jgi:flavodoxin